MFSSIGIFSSLLLTTFYSLLPAVLCIYFYCKCALVLLKRSKKIGRNLNLIMCFAAICTVWTICLITKIVRRAYMWYLTQTSTQLIDIFGRSFVSSYGRGEIVILLGSFTSIVDPVLILICQKDYRKPITKVGEKIKTMLEKIKAAKK